MTDRKTVDFVIGSYDLQACKEEVAYSALDTYPHVTVLSAGKDIYYLKELEIDRQRAVLLENVYRCLESERDFLHPIKNKAGLYLTEREDGGSVFLLTRKEESCAGMPDAGWWANCLARLHGKTSMVFGKVFPDLAKANTALLPEHHSVLQMLKETEDWMEQDVNNMLYSLLPDNHDFALRRKHGSLVHGDPLKSNVLRADSAYILFDFASCGLSLKEYDIQRLFADKAAECNDNLQIRAFIEDFIRIYERAGEKIDRSALSYLFRLDLVRTICWLYQVSASSRRQDGQRQKKELERYRAALRSGSFHQVLSQLLHKCPYDLTTIRIHQQEEIMHVARLLSSVVPDFVCVTLGGSRSHFLEDGTSDVEMYFYSRSGVPKAEALDRVLTEAGAQHKRSDSFLWAEEPWGPHSFFLMHGLYFEVGYRVIGEIEDKLNKYLSGELVEPQKDCHDLGMGYLYSGLAASVQAEKLLLSVSDGFNDLKEMADRFPACLKGALREEYMVTARSMLQGKLLAAVHRKDTFFYGVLSARVIRCLMIMAFSLTGTHFPGDKWNEILLRHTGWEHADRFLQLLNTHMQTNAGLEEKYRLLDEAYSIVEEDLEKGNRPE